MNKRKMIGLVSVFVSLVLAGCILAQGEGVVTGFFGKAVWYLPYVALVKGVAAFVSSVR